MRKQQAFTFIELMVTLAIIAVLALIAVPLAQRSSQRIKEQDLRIALREIRGGIDAYKRAADQGRITLKPGESGYPPSLAVLVDGIEDIHSPTHKKMYFLRKLPADPFFPDVSAEPESTWAKRSYASPANEPQEGDDVFDVYSMSTQTGSNGISYKDW
ncbi:type II secretion system protein [Andreprevotia chitinilytica]|uniref:type II secretion system protein n=1 Tax=Andreprevotia chitinilytica TaxID=396808 RepID=UPI000556CB17|nr:type II secretion system protein [Andreprevotia chitinilytica]